LNNSRVDIHLNTVCIERKYFKFKTKIIKSAADKYRLAHLITKENKIVLQLSHKKMIVGVLLVGYNSMC